MQLDRRLYRTTSGRICEHLEPGESGMLLGTPGHIITDDEAFRLGVTDYLARTRVKGKAVHQQEVEDKALRLAEVEDKAMKMAEPRGPELPPHPDTSDDLGKPGSGIDFPPETRRGPGRPPRSI